MVAPVAVIPPATAMLAPPIVSPIDAPNVTGARPNPRIAIPDPAIAASDPVIREMFTFR